jgi:hypothetical protein
MSFVPEFTPSVSDLQAINPPYIADRWYPMAMATVAAGTATASGSVRLNVFVLRRPMTVSDLGARVTTAATDGLFQLAIYANNPATGRPTGAVLARTAGISTTSTGAISGDITGANVVLPAGVYWAAVNVDATGATAGFQTTAAGFPFGFSLVGGTALSDTSASATNASLTLTTPMAYDTWSDISGNTFTENNTTIGVFLFLKAA